MQPPLVQRFLETQASSVAEAVIQGLPQVRFTLPDRVVLQKQDGEAKTASVPSESREQITGGLMDRLMRTDLRTALRLRLGELEQSSNRAVSVSAGAPAACGGQAHGAQHASIGENGAICGSRRGRNPQHPSTG